MANASTTGFGFKPVKMAGQSANTAGLGEYPVAANATAIYNQDLVDMQAGGTAAVTAAGDQQILGSLNGVFSVSYTHLRAPRDRTRSRMPSSA